MASANSLLGLVNQLQSMEHHFTTILVETILKLTSLTDAKVFVLVESQDCRRIAGAEHLCRSFADGSLQPASTDRQVRLLPDVLAISEEPLLHSSSNDDPQVMSIRGSNVDPANSPPGLNRKRHQVGGPRRARPPKERRLHQQFKREPDIQAFSTSDLNAMEALAADASFGADVALAAEASFSLDAANDSADSDAFRTTNENGLPAASSGDHGDQNGDFTIEDDSFAEIVFSKPPSNEEAATSGHKNGGGAFVADGQNDLASTPPAYQDLPFIDEFLRTNHKVGPVMSIYDDSVTEKNSVSNKVTLSLVYDFAKCLFTNCGFASFKDFGFREFFEASFEKFWRNFPNFAAWEEMNMRFQERVDKRTNMCRMATPKSFLRQKIRINVINLMLTKTKSNQGGRVNSKKSLPYY